MDDFVALTHEPIRVEDVYHRVVNPASGGISLFVGTTRDTFEGKAVLRLEYEAYERMAEKVLREICVRVMRKDEAASHKARERWAVSRVAVVHRLGHVAVTDASVVVAVSSKHRREAIEACGWLIDEIKRSVPIWKKELYEDGSQWKENSESSVPKHRG